MYEKKRKKPNLFDRYSKQRVLPYIKMPIENIVIIAVGLLVLVIVSYAVGVEKGKRLPVLGDVRIASRVKGQGSREQSVEHREEEPESKNEEIEDEEQVLESQPQDIEEKLISDSRILLLEEEPIAEPEESKYIIQLASFNGAQFAEEEINKLERRGVRADSTKKGQWYQVYAVGFQTIDQAREAKRGLIDDYEDCYIRRMK